MVWGGISGVRTVRREDTHVTTPDEFLVVETQDRVVRVQELWVENDFDAVRGSVEELDPTDLVQNRVVGIVGHVMGRDRWERVTLERKDSTFEQNLIFLAEQGGWVGHFGSVLAAL
jgi:hypothetical protein